MIERLDMEEKYDATEAAIYMNRYGMARNYCKGKVVLDISCGEGYGSFLLSKWGAKEVVGIDISEEAIKKAKKNFKAKNVKYLVQDASNLKKLDDNYFDLVVSFETFEHIKNCDDYLREIKRVSKKDATIVISCPNDYYYYATDEQFNPYHMRKYTFEDFKKQAENILGNNVTYLIGTELMGFINTLIESNTVKQNKDMVLNEDSIYCAKINNGKGQDLTKCNYYIGVWNAKKVDENCVVYSHMYPEWDTTINKYKNEAETLRNEIESIKGNYEIEKDKLKTRNLSLSMQKEEISKFSEKTYDNLNEANEELVAIRKEFAGKLQELAIVRQELDNTKQELANVKQEFDNTKEKLINANNELFSSNEELEMIKKSRSYKLARKVSKAVKIVRRK